MWTKLIETEFSDERLKKDVHLLSDSLKKLLQLKGVSYKWKDPSLFGNTEEVQQKQVGFIAQEVEEVFPQWVSEQEINKKNFKTLEIKNINFQALTVEAIKELEARVRKVEENIAEINGKS
ncbi:MAG: tail fiber domain-containing protein [Candidatus Electrothrix sp. AW2]|nr:tail fiber domain-containing protein [Candidatus Electrothrix gigas]